uniref:Uncharacterized protein n=1 Tax=Arundo donax TaxID=35708 RepID=A0A0A9FFS0_ARUDO
MMITYASITNKRDGRPKQADNTMNVTSRKKKEVP